MIPRKPTGNYKRCSRVWLGIISIMRHDDGLRAPDFVVATTLIRALPNLRWKSVTPAILEKSIVLVT